MLSRPPWNRRSLGVRPLAHGLASSLVLAGALAAFGGCAQLLGIDDLSGARDAAPPPDELPPPGIDAGVDTTCSDGVVPGGGTGTTPIDTEAAGNDFTASCGGESSPDQMLVWTAPVTDYYVFDTFGSGFDTVLGLYAECAGEEFACSNNVGEMGQSEVVRKFEGGQRALVLVDGAAGDSGQGALNIERVTCPDSDVEGLNFPVELTTLGFGNEFKDSPCGGADHEDRAYHWVAPVDGLYYFRATSDTFTPAITLLDGPRCSDRVLACGGAFFGPYGAEVVRYLSARQAVSVVVDGVNGAGLFTLDIGLTRDQTCSESVISAEGAAFVDDFTERTLAPSCAFARQSDSDMQLYDAPDKVYTLIVPGAGECFGECGVTVTASQEFVLYGVETEQCGGAELGCILGQSDGMSSTATITFPRGVEDRRHTVVVADRSELDGGGGFRVEAFCLPLACP